MSWEAWGTPPDTEPELCPICDNTQHTPDKCEVAASEAHSRTYYEGVLELLRADHERKLTAAYAEGRKDEREHIETVDWHGLALELEAQAKRVESKTAMRAMYSAALGLYLMGNGGRPVAQPVNTSGASGSPARHRQRPDGQDLNPDLSASASPATKEQQ